MLALTCGTGRKKCRKCPYGQIPHKRFILESVFVLFVHSMDPNTSFNLEIRIIAPNCRFRWFMLDKVVEADVTNFRDLDDGVVDKYPCGYGDIVRLFYFCMDSKVNIEVCSDQDLVEMFAKHKAIKCCLLTLSYHSPSVKPPEIPDWDFSTIPSIQPSMTSSAPLAEPSHATHTQLDQIE